jgi:replicative DNA helicase
LTKSKKDNNLRIEQTILSNLLVDEEYSRKVTPFLQAEYFSDKSENTLMREITGFFVKYNKLPNKEVLHVQLAQKQGLTESELQNCLELVEQFGEEKVPSRDWLVERTEEFCKEKSLYNAILKSIKIIDGGDTNLTQNAIPQLLQDALSVSFDTAIGHSYTDDIQSRYEFYTRKEERIPFDLELLDKVTKGGLPKKSLTMVVAESGGGKSLVLCHASASYLKQGRNVLYITMEMAEERIAERIDANLLNVDIDNLSKMSNDEFSTKVQKAVSKTHGKLVIKEYPTGAAHAGHFRGLIEELKIKKNFVPDVIVVDYLGICSSSRMKHGAGVNSYTYIKSISEELRALGVEYNVPVLTAMQVNRGGFGNSELELTDISESIGVVMTCDFVFSIIRTEELDELGQTLIKILKNRYGDIATNRKFVIGINRARMKLYDLEGVAQQGISGGAAPVSKSKEPDVPLFDSSKKKDYSKFVF